MRAYRTQVAPHVSLHLFLTFERPHLPFACLRMHFWADSVFVHATTLTPGANGGKLGVGGLAGGEGGGFGLPGGGGIGEGGGGDIGGAGDVGGAGGEAGGGKPFWQTVKSVVGQ